MNMRPSPWVLMFALALVAVVILGLAMRAAPSSNSRRRGAVCSSTPGPGDTREVSPGIPSSERSSSPLPSPDVHSQGSATVYDTEGIENQVKSSLAATRAAIDAADVIAIEREVSQLQGLWNTYSTIRGGGYFELMIAVADALADGGAPRIASTIVEQYLREKAYPSMAVASILIKAYDHDKKYGMLCDYTPETLRRIPAAERARCEYAVANARCQLGMYEQALQMLTDATSYRGSAELVEEYNRLRERCDQKLNGGRAPGDTASLQRAFWMEQLRDVTNTKFVRTKALEAISGDPSGDASDLLAGCAHDPDVSIRRSAVRAIGVRRDRRSIPLLRECLHDVDVWVQREARIGLQASGEVDSN